MRKTKKLLSLLLFITVAASLFAPTVFASPCCEVVIQGVTEGEESVEVEMSCYLYLAPREIEVYVYMQNAYEMTTIASETVTVSSTYETVTVSFDKSVFLEGCTYKILPAYKELCSIGNCYAEAYTYIAKEGTPVLDVKEISGKPFDLAGGAEAAVGLKTDAAGFYDLSIVDETGNVSIYNYLTGYRVWSGRKYYAGGQTLYYVIKNEGDVDSTITVSFDYVPVEESGSLITAAPENDEKCFSIEGDSGMRKINITTKGVYLFKCSGIGRAYYRIYDRNGFSVANLYNINNEVCKLLSPGSYYVDSDNAGSDVCLDIYYTVPDEVKFDTSYILKGYEDENYYTITLERPAYISIDSDSGNIKGIIQSLSEDNSVFIPDSIEVLPVGSYCFNAYNYSGDEETEDSFRLSKTEVDSLVLDEEAAPVFTNQRGFCFYAFMAPYDGEFEFDFSKGESSTGKYFNMDDYCNDDFSYREMKENEWVAIRVYGDASKTLLTVRAVGDAQFAELALDTPQQIEAEKGRRFYYSFTPTETDAYKIKLNDMYSNIKVYTENNVLFDGSAQNMKLFDLETGEPVYIVVIGGSVQNSIEIAKGVIKLESEKAFTLEQTTSTDLHFCPEKDGFYKLNIQKSGYSRFLNVYVNDKYAAYIGSQNGANANVTIYARGGENVLLTFSPCGTGYDCTATITVTEIEAESVYADQSTAVSYGANYIFTPEESGVYGISEANNYSLNFEVISSLGGEPVYNNYGDAVFGAVAGEKYLLSVNVSDDIIISKISAETAELNTLYTTGAERAVFEADIPDDGYYRIENNLSNTDMRILFNNEWITVSGTYSNLFPLKKGTALIMTNPIEYNDASDAKAAFKIEPSDSETEMSISAEDLFYLPLEKACARFLVTAPEGKEVSYGFEYTCEDGTTGTIEYGYESMFCSDRRYTQVTYIRELSLGSTYTIKPFLYPNDSIDEKVYGEEKTITLNEANIERLLYRSNPVSVRVQDNYNYLSKEIYMEFVQPENAPDKTYITVPDYISYFSVYDEALNYVSTKYDENFKAYYQLSPNEKYYIVAQSYGDGNAPITVSSLPESYSISNATVNKAEGAVSFTLPDAAVQGSAVYAALYGNEGTLIEICGADEPYGEQSLKFESMNDAKECKLIYVIKDCFLPLCESTVLKLED